MTDRPVYRGSGSPHGTPGDGRDRFRPRVVGSGTPTAFEEEPLQRFIESEKARTKTLREIYALDGLNYPPQPPAPLRAAPTPDTEPPPPPRKKHKAELGQLLRGLAERPNDSELIDLIQAHIRRTNDDR